MNIKMKFRSQYVFMVFLAGLTNCMQADFDNGEFEKEGHRLQITGATNQILAAIDASDLDIAGNGVGTVIVGGTTYTANTNDLTSISLAIAAIEGSGFSTTTDSLKIISDNQGTQGLGALATSAQAVAIAQSIAASQVVTIANATALNLISTTFTAGSWATVYGAITDALTLPTTQVEIAAITSAITALGACTASVGYTPALIDRMVLQLQAAVTNWDALIS